MNQKFYICKHCGNVIEKVEDEIVVSVGEVEHPMTAEHWIEWVSLKTDKGIQRKYLKPGEKPSVDFKILEGEEVEEVYAYCNLHGLWKK